MVLYMTQGALIPRDGVPEVELAQRGVLNPEGSVCLWLIEYSQTLGGMDMESYCTFAGVMEVILSTLRDTDSLNPSVS